MTGPEVSRDDPRAPARPGFTTAEPEISVSITDTEFTIDELQEFIQRVLSVDGMPPNPLVTVDHDHGSPMGYTLRASTGYGLKPGSDQ